jgi:hypothetical protein
MATTFYLPGASAPAPAVSPAFDAGWTFTGDADRTKLTLKGNWLATAASNKTATISASGNTLNRQFVSDPIPAQNFGGYIHMVARCSQDATTTNCTLAFVARLVSNDGTVVRGTFCSVFGVDTALDLTGAPSTRASLNNIVPALTAQQGDRIVCEIGFTSSGPSPAGSAISRFITDSTIADYTGASAVTSTGNPWVIFTQNLWGSGLNNYQGIKADSGISVSEKIR